jgi:pentatricopeptide repeat protein
MRSVGCKPDTLFYNALIHTLGRAGRVEEAVRVFEVEMPNTGVSPNKLLCFAVMVRNKKPSSGTWKNQAFVSLMLPVAQGVL